MVESDIEVSIKCDNACAHGHIAGDLVGILSCGCRGMGTTDQELGVHYNMVSNTAQLNYGSHVIFLRCILFHL